MQNPRNAGFTLVEMVAVIAIIGILAMISVPSIIDRIVHEQIAAAIPLSDIAKKPIAAAWASLQAFPANNSETGLPAADKVVSNLVKSLSVEDGVIHLTFGNSAHGAISGKILSLRPAVIEESPVVPVAWVCGNAPVPEKMVVKGVNKTNLDLQYLPSGCRGGSGK